ncbi:peroxide stress protein YaaA [Nocardioides marmorisolisilvae]|uniref:Peroxide stress protein YaaA n=1 Tax=Nocardioides marmorisolisilvae TaxID=1542737 RepID=A0A3N0DTJ9_9ACTN|nr:peroxide stress protein YaaA [Nocardioides marmorisolisilvae]RNL78932.1 peroxide stress protein YaaA [Nocardioides marmorisolisilvae]
MLILLPPSEGKFSPRRGKPLSLDALESPELTGARATLLAALVDLCANDPDKAAAALGLGPTQAHHLDGNTLLHEAPTARADKIYTGVLYDALDLATLTGAARGRATRWLAIMSSLFGVVRPSDAIPSYRLSGDTNLPGIGIVSSYWRDHLDTVLAPAAGNGLVIDLRSSMYAGFWRPSPEIAKKVATVRVLHEHNGQRKVVSHFNKATKGRIVRDLLLDGRKPETPTALAKHLTDLGWNVELHPVTKTGQQLDVVVSEL